MRRQRGSGGNSAAGVLAAVAVLASGTLWGCVTGGVASQSREVWREDMGRVTRVTLETGLDKIVRKHALQIARTQDSSREIYYETLWMNREVLAEEEARGVTNARNRILLKGRRLESTMAGAGVYRITWELENEVTEVGVEGWHPDAVPGQVVEEFRPIYSDLMLEVRTGLIR